MSTNNFHQITQRSCKKCGGRSKHAVTIQKTADNDAYEVYQCVQAMTDFNAKWPLPAGELLDSR